MERAPGAAQGHSASIHPHLLRACRVSLDLFLRPQPSLYTGGTSSYTAAGWVMQLVWRNTRCFMYLGVCGSLFISRCSRKVGIKSGEASVLRPNESSMFKRRAYILKHRVDGIEIPDVHASVHVRSRDIKHFPSALTIEAPESLHSSRTTSDPPICCAHKENFIIPKTCWILYEVENRKRAPAFFIIGTVFYFKSFLPGMSIIFD